MGTFDKIYSALKVGSGEVWAACARLQSRAKCHTLDPTNRRALERPSRSISAAQHLPSPLPTVEESGGFRQDAGGTCGGFGRAWGDRFERRLHRWNICSRKKRGAGVGKTKRGKGTKIMGLTDAGGLPIAIDAGSASPHEVTLVEQTLDACFLKHLPPHVIGDKAYDSDPLDERLADERHVELISPHKTNRKKPATQDGRKLRRYSRRWKVERLFAWLQNFRRLVVRYEYHLTNFLAMIKLGCVIILLRKVLG
jgi:transposase